MADADLQRLLEDDVRFGDLTTRVLGIGPVAGRITFASRGAMRLCGVEEAAHLMEGLGAEVTFSAASGAEVASGGVILSATGTAGVLHAGWKTAQILMEFASGVATAAAAVVAAARSVAPGVAVMVTRKSIPFTRALSLKAALAGGAEIHRLGLYDTLMVFPEHLVFRDGGLANAVAAARRLAPERSVMVEVKDQDGFNEAVQAGADVIQLEKFSPEATAIAVRGLARHAAGRPVIAAAGGINAQNAAEYAAAGVDTLVTSAPFYAKPLDVEVTMEYVSSGRA